MKTISNTNICNFAMPLPLSEISNDFIISLDDFIFKISQLRQHMLKSPISVLCIRMNDEAMIEAGIHKDDLLIIDMNSKPIQGKVVAAEIDGQLKVGRLYKDKLQDILFPQNVSSTPIEITANTNIKFLGTVTASIHPL